MVEEGTDVASFESFTLEDAGGEKAAPEPPKEEASESSETPKSAPAAPKEEAPAAQESESTGERLQPSLDREPNISPAAKVLALEKGIAIKSVKGTGPGGRITKQDIEKAKPSGGATPAAAGAGPTYEDTPATSMRKTI